MIDILMAVFNGEKYLRQQIDSILNQSCTEWRLLIRDDGSSDGTISIVNEYLQKYPNKIFLVEDGIKAHGVKYNFFQLMKAATGDYIMLSDQDDVWEYNKVKNAYDYIIKAERSIGKDKPILCHSDLHVVDEELNVINESMAVMQKLDLGKNKLKDYLVQNNVTGCTIIFNSKLKELCIKMPIETIMHDWWLALIASAFGRVCYMKSVDILYRQHGDNAEGAKNLKSIRYLVDKMFNGKEVKKTLELTYKQAETFLKEYKDCLDRTQIELINAYISLKNASKLKKYMIMFKYGFMKSGLARKIGYILFV